MLGNKGEKEGGAELEKHHTALGLKEPAYCTLDLAHL